MKSPIIRTTTVFALGALVLSASLGQNAVPDLKKLEGNLVPRFTLTDLSGKSASNEQLKGSVVLLDFWATWCGPCKAASPHMQRLHQTYGRQGLTVIGATTFEQGDVKKKVTDYFTEHRYTYTFTTDNSAMARAWGVSGIPSFVLIDRKGVVRKTWVGFGENSMRDMEVLIRTLLSEKT